MVLFCLHQRSRLRPALKQSDGFVVNLLTSRQEPSAWAFAGKGGGPGRGSADLPPGRSSTNSPDRPGSDSRRRFRLDDVQTAVPRRSMAPSREVTFL
ncbi:flavin reductase family protein [Streptomyces sp. NBC_00873]|nr:flavin reductase family protein [Streptomyces sp. NBC_00873]